MPKMTEAEKAAYSRASEMWDGLFSEDIRDRAVAMQKLCSSSDAVRAEVASNVAHMLDMLI